MAKHTIENLDDKQLEAVAGGFYVGSPATPASSLHWPDDPDGDEFTNERMASAGPN